MTKVQALKSDSRQIVHIDIGRLDFDFPTLTSQAGIVAIQAEHCRFFQEIDTPCDEIPNS